MTKKYLLTALIAVASFAASAQNLVTNGDLNSPTASTTATSALAVGTKLLPGWTVTNAPGAGGYWNFYYPTADASRGPNGTLWSAISPVVASPAGGSFIGMDGDTTVSTLLNQTIGGLEIGKTYNLSFYFAGAQMADRSGATTEWWDVTFGNSKQRTEILTNESKGFTGWKLATMSFVATGTTQVLSFLAGGTPNGLPPMALLDGITLTAAVPEPSTMASMLLGVLVLGGLRLRAHRKNKG